MISCLCIAFSIGIDFTALAFRDGEWFSATPQNAVRTHEETISGGRRVVYEGFGKAFESVVCTLRESDDESRWRIAVKTKDGWTLDKVNYPKFEVVEGERFLLGDCHGGVRKVSDFKAGETLGAGRSPGKLAVQLAALYGTNGCFLTYAEDGVGFMKGISAVRTEKGVSFVWEHYGDGVNGYFETSYDIVARRIAAEPGRSPDWQDAADVYRIWAERQRWCKRKYRDRGDVPMWMKDAPAMTRFIVPKDGNLDFVSDWLGKWGREHPGVPLIAAFWGWEKNGMWIGADYYPLKGGNAPFAKLVEDMRKGNAHAFLWPSGYFCVRNFRRRADGTFEFDDLVRLERSEEWRHLIENPSGKAYVREPWWLRGGTACCLCVGDAWTRQWWDEKICRPAARLGVEMFQMDQMIGGSQVDCLSRKHGHPHRGGRWIVDAFRQQIGSTLKTVREETGSAVFGFEEPGEHYNDLVGIQDYRDCETASDEWANFFTYLYHEYVPCFQSNPRNGDRYWLAHCVADGQVPFVNAVKSDHPFFRRWIDVYRGEGREFIAYGRRTKAPRIACGTTTCDIIKNGKIVRTVAHPAVCSAAYCAADGRRAVVLVNATDREQPVSVVTAKDTHAIRPLKPEEIRMIIQ